MSSTLRKFSQIPVRTKYLLVASNPIGQQGPPLPNFVFATASIIGPFTASNYQPYTEVGSVRTLAELTTIYGAGTVISTVIGTDKIGDLFKDMGRALTIVDASGNHLSTYRECQLVNGGGSEGVIDNSPLYNATYYVRVWAADGSGVAVARTG